ncbi:MAG: DUF4910 domain-containing protein [Bacteroidota bacterium]|jgi:aminopeptidase-like protein
MSEEKIEFYFDRLWPICRSITGNGLRDSYKILQELIPLNIVEIPTGTKVFDWEIPKEWNITDAYIITPDGKKICDFKLNNLHVLNYSSPIDRELSFVDLSRHIHTLPDLPNAIPYVTSYYEERWGFCMSHEEFLKLPTEGMYKVKIDSSLKSGSLTYGDLYLPGETDQEILLSTYLCHPSMANNELSGPLVLSFLYEKILSLKKRRFSYRFIFVPETIGAISYLSRNGALLKEKVFAGYVITCVGDSGQFTFKRSKRRDDLVNVVAEHVLRFSGENYSIIDFQIGGSDERQYCSPGFNLPVGSLMRTMYQRYKEYHTSLDDKNFISFSSIQKSIEMYFKIVKTHELNDFYINTVSFCEPNLGKRGLYNTIGGAKQRSSELSKRLHLLSFSDGKIDLINIADRMNISALDFEEEINLLLEKGLLKKSC